MTDLRGHGDTDAEENKYIICDDNGQLNELWAMWSIGSR